MIYGIKIAYSWGEEENFIPVGDKDKAWQDAVKIAGAEAEAAGIANDSEISLYFAQDQSKITLHYLYDDTYCYYEIIPQKTEREKKED